MLSNEQMGGVPPSSDPVPQPTGSRRQMRPVTHPLVAEHAKRTAQAEGQTELDLPQPTDDQKVSATRRWILEDQLQGPTLDKESYYNQSEKGNVQESLFPMTPQDHMDAVAKAVGANRAMFQTTDSAVGPTHSIHVLHPDGETSWMSWNGNTGEIGMISSSVPGTAKHMHDAARKIATENPGIAFPRHSPARTPEGVQWSRKEMERHGEQVW